MLLQLAVHYRALYLYAIHAHQTAAKVAFFPDHEFFAEVYGTAASFYDQVAERYIGKNGDEQFDSVLITQKAMEILAQLKTKGISENKEYYQEILKQINAVIPMADKFAKDPSTSAGTQNLIAGQCDIMESLIYKISRRIK